MEPSEWIDFFADLADMGALVDRVTAPDAEPVFMVGSALSASEQPDSPGVPGVRDMLGLIEDLVQRQRLDVEAFHSKLGAAGRNGTAAYEAAFKFLRQRRGSKVANGVIQDAVRRARDPSARQLDDDQALEKDLEGWVLPRGTAALGVLLARLPDLYPGPTLTTNFDPLLSIAVRKAGGFPRRTVLDGDGGLPTAAESDQQYQDIIYLHGYWRDSDTHHLGIELTAPRPQLDASLGRLIDKRLVVVVGYGGWKDVFMRTISRLLRDGGARPDIAWALFEDEPGGLFANHGPLLDSFDEWRSRGRLELYKGVNAHDFFEQVLARAGIPLPRRDDTFARHGPVNEVSKLNGLVKSAPVEVGVWTAATVLGCFANDYAGGIQEDSREGCDDLAMLRLRLTDVRHGIETLRNPRMKEWADAGIMAKFRSTIGQAALRWQYTNDALDRGLEYADDELGALVDLLKQAYDLIDKNLST